MVRQVRTPAFKARPLDLHDPLHKLSSAALIVATRESTILSSRLIRSIVKGLQFKDPDAYIALLLVVCPNVQKWELDIAESVYGSRKSSFLINANVRDSGSLGALQEVTAVHSGGGHSCVDLMDLAPIMLHSSLQSFTAQRVYCGSSSKEVPYEVLSYERPTTLQDLELLTSSIDAEGVRTILTICPTLRSLAIHWADAVTGLFHTVNWGSIGDILRQNGRKLQRLRLDVTGKDPSIPRGTSGKPLGSLHRLERLQDLAVPAHALRGDVGMLVDVPSVAELSDLLPSSLAHLEIHALEGYHAIPLREQIRRITSDQNECFPSLRSILLRTPHGVSSIPTLPLGSAWRSSESDSTVLLQRS
ncbi:hypothetical protein KC364_g7784 [Hortaea werneckii]|nr:hypothetical protein KC350_g4440 [Hortaea werneckii]KAI7466815.1 hypothetical protein KC364_g7784 [Hortaea werneckii]